jgi:hypothetical protein
MGKKIKQRIFDDDTILKEVRRGKIVRVTSREILRTNKKLGKVIESHLFYKFQMQ